MATPSRPPPAQAHAGEDAKQVFGPSPVRSETNQNPKLLTWTVDPDEIIDNVGRGKQALEDLLKQADEFRGSRRRGLDQEGYDMLACYRREPFEKVVDCVTGFDVIEQGLYRNPCAIKHCGAAHHLGATADNRLFHGNTLPSNPREVYVDSGDTSETL